MLEFHHWCTQAHTQTHTHTHARTHAHIRMHVYTHRYIDIEKNKDSMEQVGVRGHLALGLLWVSGQWGLNQVPLAWGRNQTRTWYTEGLYSPPEVHGARTLLESKANI